MGKTNPLDKTRDNCFSVNAKGDSLNISPDYTLIQQVEIAVDGQSAHHAAGMIAAYLAGMEEATESGDPRYVEFAEEAERTLRMYLTTLRMRQAEFQRSF